MHDVIMKLMLPLNLMGNKQRTGTSEEFLIYSHIFSLFISNLDQFPSERFIEAREFFVKSLAFGALNFSFKLMICATLH